MGEHPENREHTLKAGYLLRDDAPRYRPGLIAKKKELGKPVGLYGSSQAVGCGKTSRGASASSSTTIRVTSGCPLPKMMLLWPWPIRALARGLLGGAVIRLELAG
jgi:hypothetical protein